MYELTIERAIAIQKEQLRERSHIIKEDVLQKLTNVLDEHNKKVVNPNKIIRGVGIDEILSNYAIFLSSRGGYDITEAYSLKQY